jgi:hypothetical protein
VLEGIPAAHDNHDVQAACLTRFQQLLQSASESWCPLHVPSQP